MVLKLPKMVLNFEENPSKGVNDLCTDNTNLLRSGKVGLSDKCLFVNIIDSTTSQKTLQVKTKRQDYNISPKDPKSLLRRSDDRRLVRRLQIARRV